MATNNTGKRKRASEENDKNGYSTKMDVDTVEDNLEETIINIAKKVSGESRSGG